MFVAPYEKLKFYQNLVAIGQRVYQLTEPFYRPQPKVVGQARNTIRSAKQNIIEDCQNDSLSSFCSSLRFFRNQSVKFRVISKMLGLMV